MTFIGRIEEMKAFEERANSGKAEFVVVYGRRRIGKTELVRQVVSKHEGLLLIGREESKKLQLHRFSKDLADHFGDELLRKQPLDNWDAFFEYLYQKAKDRPLILALDEFPYMVKEDHSLPSLVQDMWDNKLSRTRLFLVLLGSSISMMSSLLGAKSPIYGRRTGQFRVQALPFRDVAGYIGDMARAVELYSVFGGTPAYVMALDRNKNALDNAKGLLLRRDSFLYQDVRFVLREEMDEPRYYYSMLEAIALGKTSLAEMVDYTGLARSLVGKYLSILIELDILRRDVPVDSQTTAKKGQYTFKDNIFSFWFRFIRPYEDLIDMGREKEVSRLIAKDLNSHIGRRFEDICLEFLWAAKDSQPSLRFLNLGRWWHHGEEIDIVGLDPESRTACFFECKWTDLAKKDAAKVLFDLAGKSRSVSWNKDDRKQQFGVIARSVEGKSELRKGGYLVFDLDDFKRVLGP